MSRLKTIFGSPHELNTKINRLIRQVFLVYANSFYCRVVRKSAIIIYENQRIQMRLTQNIEGYTLQLEPIVIQHREELRSAANHACIWDYMPMKAYGCFFDSWFQDLLIKHQTGTQLSYFIRKKADQRLVGGHSYYDIDFDHKRLEVGYSWLTPAVWGSRLIHESLWLLFHNAFETWGMNRIQLAADPRNKRSYNILKKLGAVEEGILRGHMIHHHGLITDTVVFSILGREWPQVKKDLGTRLHLEPKGPD